MTVKDQGNCGSCWAFAAIADVEAGRAVKNLPNILFSEQELVDCTILSAGCNGGYVEEAFIYMSIFGISTGSAYPYTAKKGSCSRSSFTHTKVSSILSPYSKYTNNVTSLKAAVSAEPVVVGVYASEWSKYTGGLFRCKNNTATPNHAVLLVGYDSNGNWRIKNSWGTTWGEKGYMSLEPNNTCSILNNPSLSANLV